MRRMLAACMAFLLLAGCGPSGEKKPEVAMGRYVESDVPFPHEEMAQVLGLQGFPDGRVALLGYYMIEDKVALKWHESTDGGATWTERESAPLGESFDPTKEEGGSVNAAAWDKDGRLYLYYEIYRGEEVPTERGIGVVDGDSHTPLGWPMPETTDGSDVIKIGVADNGDILLGGWAEIQQVDQTTGEVKYTYTPKSKENAIDGWDVAGNTLWFNEGETLRSVDLTTGKDGASVTVTAPTNGGDTNYGTVYRMVGAGQDGGVYYADDHGLFRAIPESSVSEKMIDGNMCSLGTPSVARMQMAVLGDGFLTLGYDGSQHRMYAYRYDATVPTVAETELKIWSLEDDPLIRQAIGSFQKSHSNVYVSYEGAITEQNGLTRDDALKTLSTELLAGKGPDVLVLDGAPLASYMDKGVLLDLAGTIQPMVDDGTLLGNMAGTYSDEQGAMYAVPALFQVPILHGDAVGVTDVKTLADWAERTKGDFVYPVNLNTPAHLLTFFYAQNPTVEELELRALLTDLKRIYDVEQFKPFEDGVSYESNFQFGALAVQAGNCGLNVGNLQLFENLYAARQVTEDMGKGTVDTLFGGDGFLPATVLGVSAQSKVADVAKEFIQAALSQQVQASKVGEGIPVNAAAFTAGTQVPGETLEYRNGRFSTYGTSYYDAEGADVFVTLHVYYPPEEWRNDMAQRLQNLKTPLLVDETVLQMLIENTKGYFEGKSTLDETMTTVMQKLNLYRSEQGK